MLGFIRTTVDTEDLVIDDDAQGQEVEHIGEVVPHVRIPIFPRTLCVEAVRLSDTSGFMVATDQSDTVWIS